MAHIRQPRRSEKRKKRKRAIPIDFASVSTYIEDQAATLPSAIHAGPEAFRRNRTPEEYELPEGAEQMSIGSFLPMIIPLLRAGFGAWRHFRTPVRHARTRAPATLFAELEEFAVGLGASAIGYAPVTPDLLFKGRAIPHSHAIVLTSEMRKEKFQDAPSDTSQKEIGKAYVDTTNIGNELTRWLRKRGYSAYGGLSLGGVVDLVRIAERAGIGAIGYHGSLISPRDGARLRINVVYTNIENLPYPEKNPHLWVRDFCALCNKCVRKCPPKAIRSTREADEHGRIAAIDVDRCGNYMVQHKACGHCIAICPFSNAGYDKIARGFAKRKSTRRRVTLPIADT